MNTLIIEDEISAASRLKKYLHAIEPKINVLEVLDSIESAVFWFETNPLPDLVFMDIHLADGICFEIFNKVKIGLPIIFTTAYDQYALQSFDHHSIDYLLKPLKKNDLERALDKFHKLKKEEPPLIDSGAGIQLDSDKHLERILVKVGRHITLLKIKDVAYFYSENKITFAMNHLGRRFPVNISLENLETSLDGNLFFRINRQYIIHMDAIKSMMSFTKGRVKVQLEPGDGREATVSTERSPHFKKWLLN